MSALNPVSDFNQAKDRVLWGMARQFMSGIPYKRGDTMNFGGHDEDESQAAKRSQRENFADSREGNFCVEPRNGVTQSFAAACVLKHASA